MPSLSQIGAISGYEPYVDEEALIQAQLPGLYAGRQRQLEEQRLALMGDAQSAEERQAKAQQKATTQATAVQGLTSVGQGAMFLEAAKPGSFRYIGESLGLMAPKAASGAAEAAGVAGGAAGTGASVASTTVPATILAGEEAAGMAASGAAGGVAGGTGATGLLAAAGPYAVVAGAGLAAGKIGGMIGPHILPFGGKTGERVERDVTGVAAGAGVGALIGTSVFPVIGTGIGAVIGGAAGLLGAESVIATATCGLEAPETQLAQAFRRCFVGPTTYAGYRVWGDKVARFLTRHPGWKPVARRVFVQPACRYFRAVLDGTPERCPWLTRVYVRALMRFSRWLGTRRVRHGQRHHLHAI